MTFSDVEDVTDINVDRFNRNIILKAKRLITSVTHFDSLSKLNQFL